MDFNVICLSEKRARGCYFTIMNARLRCVREEIRCVKISGGGIVSGIGRLMRKKAYE
jgi:hypothetical protein